MTTRPDVGSPPEFPDDVVARIRRVREDFTRLMLSYRFGIQKVSTKVQIMREEFTHLHSYNPIEHVSSRLKSPESVLDKAARKGIEPTLDGIRAHITDIAGIRVICSFISDTYTVFDALTQQPDITVLEVRDYIDRPKPNGYRSLHAIVEVPVFLSTGEVGVPVELQFRTVAMDFWASLEHKIFYKYEGDVPPELVRRLAAAAATAARLDEEMEEVHALVRGPREAVYPPPAPAAGEEAGSTATAPISEEVVRRLIGHILDISTDRLPGSF